MTQVSSRAEGLPAAADGVAEAGGEFSVALFAIHVIAGKAGTRVNATEGAERRPDDIVEDFRVARGGGDVLETGAKVIGAAERRLQ